MKKTAPKVLNLKQQAFCKNYVSKEFFGNGTESYIDAYKIDVSKPGAYAGARSSAWRMLTNADILAYINDLLDGQGLNDAFVDKQLLLILTQNADFGSKLGAIKEYNKLKQRIVEKVEMNLAATIKETTNFSIKRRK